MKTKFREVANLDIEYNSLSADEVMSKYHPFDPDDPDEDRTIQSAVEDADINVMIKRFGLAKVAQPQPAGYYDLSELTDFQTSLNLIDEMRGRFMEIPAGIRAQFDNDPGQFAGWLRDENNHEEARKMGLLTPKAVEPPPMKVEVTNAVTRPATVEITQK